MILVSKVIGNMDFPGAKDIAEMIEKLLPPEITGRQDQMQPRGPNQEAIMNAAKLRTEMMKSDKLDSEIQLNQQKLSEGQQETQNRMRAVAQGSQDATLQKLKPFMVGGRR